MTKDKKNYSIWYITGVVSLYFVISISLVFINKILLTEGSSIPAPFFTTAYQCVITVAICWVLGRLGRNAKPGTLLSGYPEYKIDPHVSRKLLPLSLIFVGMCAFNNLSLQYVEASFYNVARSLTVVFNVVLSYFVLGHKPSSRVLLCLSVVIAGFIIGTKGEVNFSFLGSVFGVIASLFVALNGVKTKTALDLVGGNQWTLCAVNNANAAIIFIPLIIMNGEIGLISRNVHIFFSLKYWLIMTIGGVAGFAIGIASILQIQATSPLTHNVSGTAKSALQTVMALYIWKNPTTMSAFAGVLLTLSGSLGYSVTRMEEMKVKNEQNKVLPTVSPPSSPRSPESPQYTPSPRSSTQEPTNDEDAAAATSPTSPPQLLLGRGAHLTTRVVWNSDPAVASAGGGLRNYEPNKDDRLMTAVFPQKGSGARM